MTTLVFLRRAGVTVGSLDVLNGAINPEKPLSLQHWMDSFAVASFIYGGYS